MKTHLCFEMFHFEFALRVRSPEGNRTILVWRPEGNGIVLALRAEVRDNVRPCAASGQSWKLWLPCSALLPGLFRSFSNRLLNRIQCKRQRKHCQNGAFTFKNVAIYVILEDQNIYCDRRLDGCVEHKRHVQGIKGFDPGAGFQGKRLRGQDRSTAIRQVAGLEELQQKQPVLHAFRHTRFQRRRHLELSGHPVFKIRKPKGNRKKSYPLVRTRSERKRNRRYRTIVAALFHAPFSRTGRRSARKARRRIRVFFRRSFEIREAEFEQSASRRRRENRRRDSR